MGVYQSAIYCIDLLAGIWCWTESTNDRCKIPIYRIFSYRDDSLVLLLRCICINYGCFSGIYLFSKESRIQYSYLAHDENPIQSVHPLILHSDWHSCRAYKWYISFSNVFTADLLFILHVCFLDRIDLADGIDPTILPDIMQLITIVLQLIMWTLPILWSPNQFDSGLVSILKLNPLYYVVQGYRESF